MADIMEVTSAHDDAFTVVVQDVQDNSVFRRVFIQNNLPMPTQATICCLCAALERNFTLVVFSLSRCFLTQTQFDAILMALRNHWRLESLDFSFIPFGPPGIRSLCLHFHTFTSVVRLNLEGCQLGDLGAIALAPILNHPHLDGVELSRNLIANHGASALAQAVISSGITLLGLSHNSIGAVGSQALLEAQHLRSIRLRVLLHGNDAVPQATIQAVNSLNNAARDRDDEELNGAQADDPTAVSFPTHRQVEDVRAILKGFLETQRGETALLGVNEGDPLPSHDEGVDETAMDVDAVPNTYHSYRNADAWNDLCRFDTFNFHPNNLIQRTETYEVYRCQSPTSSEKPLFLGRIHPNKTGGTVNRQALLQFFMHNTVIDGYTPVLCVVLPQDGNMYIFFRPVQA